MAKMSLRGWAAWGLGLSGKSAWRAWAHGAGDASGDDAPPDLGDIPPLLRRRAGRMGRGVLHVLTRPELPYAGQSVVMCSRLGEIGRSFALQKELATEMGVSPQQFSMSVHNAIGGLFMMAKKAHAPLTALAAGGEEALAGLLETAAQLADGAGPVWLLFGEEPLPDEYRPLAASPRDGRDHYAFVLELAAGDEFDLTQDVERFAPGHAASPLGLLAFLLRSAEDEIRLSRHGGWALRRTGVSGRRK